MRTFLKRAINTVTFYPLTGFYVGAVAVLMLFAGDYIQLQVAILSVTSIFVGAVLFSMHQEVRMVHVLVNSQRTELIARIDQLTSALDDAGVPIPDKRKSSAHE